MSDPLKSCPFCGGEAKFDFDAFGHIRVICVACGARSKSGVTSLESVEKDAEDIAATWNRRADIASIRHAKWVWVEVKFENGMKRGFTGCSRCHAPLPTDSMLDCMDESDMKFCYECGSLMDEKEESE